MKFPANAYRFGLRPHLILIGSVVALIAATFPQSTGERTWPADSEVAIDKALTDLELGAAQGVAVRDGKIYAYGDRVLDQPRIGIIREYDQNLKWTGRQVMLTRDGKPVITHPTGLTWNSKFGTFLGDTVNKKSRIYRLAWERAWADGNLDHAVLAEMDDDIATNGGRPTFVGLKGRVLLATADYGDVEPELRLYDPEGLLRSKKSSAPGVIIHRIPCGPFNQNLHWDETKGQLTFVQNVIEGRGWRLVVINFEKAIDAGSIEAPAARVSSKTFTPADELEGWWPLDADRSLFAAARRKDNLITGTIRPVAQ
jgi:hypothetical protein